MTITINNSILAIIGFILSAYSVYVEHKVEMMQEDPANNNPEIEEFKALCDIEAIGASCRWDYYHRRLSDNNFSVFEAWWYAVMLAKTLSCWR